jgi:UDP-glucuronate decarboxylase
MKILVTGGAGFIGSHLCERLLGLRHEVFCLDNFITGNPKNLGSFKGSPNFHLFEHDVNLPLTAEISDKIEKLDQIYHLACPASPVDYKEIPLQTLWVNAAGTKNMLELAVKQNVSGFLHASTSEIYGDPLQHPQKESYWGNVNPVGERSCYNEGKRFAESLAMNYWKHYRFPLKIARIFNTYGPRMRKHDGRVIPEFINKALAGEPLRVHGDGRQTRSFCYVEDMTDGLVAAMNTPKDFIGPVNLGNPEEISMLELANKIVEMTGSASIVSFAPLPEDDPLKRQPDISLAEKTFGFNPKTSLGDGLKRTIAFFSDRA